MRKTFDNLRFAQGLRAAGVHQGVAEIHAGAAYDVLTTALNSDRLPATRAGLSKMRPWLEMRSARGFAGGAAVGFAFAILLLV